MFGLKLLAFTLVFTLLSCTHFKSEFPNEQATHKAAATVFGWFDGNCFATMRGDLKLDADIFVVNLDAPQTVSSAKVVDMAKAETCGPLSSDRRQQNESEGLKFYTVKSDHALALAIGVVGELPQSSIIDGSVQADIGNDGSFESFSYCATSEGLSFDIWPSTPYEQEPVWSGYYYLGYDIERNCP